MTSLHGPQDRRKKSKRILSKPRRDPWRKRGLSRADRVITVSRKPADHEGRLCRQANEAVARPTQIREGDLWPACKADGRRKIRLAIKSEPRGNGKTGLLAGLALCHLLGPECEPRGEVYSAAYNKLQAALIFAEMKAIIEAVPEFAARVQYATLWQSHRSDGGRRRRHRSTKAFAPMTSARTA